MVRRSISCSRPNAMQRQPSAFRAKALGRANHPAPLVINPDKYVGCQPAIVQLKAEGAPEENCQHRPVQYLNNVPEQDQRAIKRQTRASQHSRCFWGA